MEEFCGGFRKYKFAKRGVVRPRDTILPKRGGIVQPHAHHVESKGFRSDRQFGSIPDGLVKWGGSIASLAPQSREFRSLENQARIEAQPPYLGAFDPRNLFEVVQVSRKRLSWKPLHQLNDDGDSLAREFFQERQDWARLVEASNAPEDLPVKRGDTQFDCSEGDGGYAS